MANSTKLSLPLVAASQAQKHVTVNETFLALDIIVQLNVLDRNLAAPPGSPAEGDAYIVAAAASGAWAGRSNQVAAYQGGGWVFYVPREGWNAWVRDENVPLVYDGTNWSSLIAAGGGLTVASLNDGSTVALLGINGATADTTNRLSVNADGVLFNQDGSGGFNLTMNKAATGDTLALTMQTGFSTRALIGLLANNDLTIKVGTSFLTALQIDNTTGEMGINYPMLLDGQASAPAAPPTGMLKLYARDRAGTQFLDVQRSSGRDFPLQPHFGVNRVAFWAPAATTTVTAVGMPVANVGTVSTPTPASTNLKSSMRRWTLTSAAVINSVSDQRSAVNACWRGNAAGLGGFNYTNRLALTTLQATGMAFFGLYGSAAALATTLLLSGVVSCIGIGFQRGTHTNWQLVRNDAAGAPTLTDLGANFPINTTDVLTLYICAAPNSSEIGVRVINETSGAIFDTTVSSDIPANTVFLSPRNYMNNDTTAAAIAFDCAGVYLETDF